MYKVVTFKRKAVINGFTVQKGFKGLLVGSKLYAVTSGWSTGDGDCYTSVYIYRRKNDKWQGGWYSQMDDIDGMYITPNSINDLIEEVLMEIQEV